MTGAKRVTETAEREDCEMTDGDRAGAITKKLFELRDPAYALFQAKLLPTVAPETIIGVRTPVLRKYAKTLLKTGEAEDFLQSLPHRFFDENQLHAFLLAEQKDFDVCISGVEAFLPFVDNWATCDQLSPKAFRANAGKLPEYIRRWLRQGTAAAEEGRAYPVYIVRFAIGMLMAHFLDEAFLPEYPEMVAEVRSDAYYVNMMRAWYFATALAKRYDAALPYLTEGRLDRWTHNKTIQKAVESFRIPPEQKVFLKTLRRTGSDNGGTETSRREAER